MGVVDLSNILIYIGAGVRPIKEGEQVFKAKHIILCGKMNNLIMGLCLQSSKLNDHPHKIEINLFEDPAKWNCVCSCKAGAGGRCKHIVALLLRLNRIDDLEKLSTTDVEQTWGKAKTNKPMEVILVNDFCHVTPFPLDVTIPENIALEFFQQCMEAVPSSEVALHVKKRTMINQQMNHKQPADESTPLISALHYQLNNPRECLLLLPKFSLPLHEESLYVTEIVTSLNDSVELAIKTKSQFLCPDWFSKRKKRITGSRAYELFTYCKNTNPNWEHKIKNIFDTKFYGNIATNYGQQHEHLAILKYEEISQKRVHKCGLIVHPSVPWLGCSPDGIVITQDRVEKIIEVPGPKLGEKINDYFEPGRGMLSDPGAFMSSLLNFDKESITEEIISKLTSYIDNPLFTPQKIALVSKACTSLCMWVHAMYKFYFVNKSVAPKKAALAKAKEDLELTERVLAAAKAKMAAVIEGLKKLNEQLQTKIDFKEEKERSINICQERMNRAVRLIGGLADEKVRWIETIASIEANTVNVTGDILISSGCVAYLTPFTDKYRRGLLSEWLRVLEEQDVPHSAKCDPVTILGEPVVIRQWQIDGLPRDYLSTENAVLVSCSQRWPLFIDPQGQANKWVKNMGKDQGISICKLADKDLMRTVESAVRFGKPVLIENVGTELDPALDPILMRQIFRQGGTWVIKLGDAVIPYNDEFQLYITTKLPNPHYTPEVAIKVLLVNFTLVPSGLQDQLLGLVVMQERPDLEEQRSALVISNAQMKQELKEIQDRILLKLSISEGSPVDDIEFIITLEASKVKSDDIKNKVEAAEITQIDIDNTRAQYIPVANRGQILFFCLSDLSNVDPMYQYSLEWFINIFVTSMADTEKSDDLNKRVEIVNEYFTFNLYSNVCRSLFEKHKLLFAFLLCVRILIDREEIDPHEWHFFLAGGSPLQDLPNPAPDWLAAKAWNEVLSLICLETYEPFVETFDEYIEDYKRIFESPEPHRELLPDFLHTSLSQFQKLLILKCLRPDKVTNAMQDYLTDQLGARFVEPQTTELTAMYKESGPTIPLIFVLSPGTDPAADLYKFADKMKFAKRLFSISLGQGQGPRAEKMIEQASEVGSWVFFQNCHLAPSWMPRLERLIETINPDGVHRDFRLWLTSAPSPHFPVAILQNSAKMTVEPPRGIKANMLKAYINQVADLSDFFHSEHPKVCTFKWLFFSLCLFHGALLERRKFGPLGFNIPYEFTDGDLKICISQLQMFLLEYSDIPFKVLTYTAGHINYGGRVTDDWDRRCLMNILADYYNIDVVNDSHAFDEDECYYQLPAESTLADYLDYLRKLPLNDDPSLFGLHSNANITCAQAYTTACLSALLLLQPKQIGGAAASQEEVTSATSLGILDILPPRFDMELITAKYPVLYEESLNTVLIQEAIRFNRLLQVIESSLKDLLKALKGLVVMSEALEKMTNSLFSNMVPDMWANKAYPSLKPLGAWVQDLLARVKFLDNWVQFGIPPLFWISGFYFPQAFLTGTLQNFARKYVLSIDSISFSYKVLEEAPKVRFKDGAVVYGLFLEGARWNASTMVLDESKPKELYTDMLPIWMIPEENHKKPPGVYECPVYKTLTRAGTLSTTGHSTNYVVAMEIPSQKSEPHWIKRGVALICALDY